MAASHGTWLSEATALFFCWALLSLLVRIWVKLTRRDKWGLDDSTIIAGLVSTTTGAMGTVLSCYQVICIFHIGCIFWAINDGYGRPLNSPKLKIDSVGKVNPPEPIDEIPFYSSFV